jgi:hypothetical protein
MRKALPCALMAAGLLISGCMTDEGQRLARQPPMPPAVVLKAEPSSSLYRNVTIEEVTGAPEFRWFDGDSVLTTRPTRAQILLRLENYLLRTDMGAPSKIQGEYMLYVDFRDLHGPDMWWLSDKQASARIYFRLVRWRTGELVKQSEVDVAYTSKFNGMSPNALRYANAVLLANSTSTTPVTVFTYSTRNTGNLIVDPLGLDQPGRPTSASGELGPEDGTSRRYAAVNGMLSLAFDEFADQLSKDGSLTYKQAVSCSDINPAYFEYHAMAVQVETPTRYGVDCPGAYYKFNRLRALYPKQFDSSTSVAALSGQP